MTVPDPKYKFEYVSPGIVRAGFSDMTDFCIVCISNEKKYYFFGVGKGQGYARIDEYVISVPDALDRVYGQKAGSSPVYEKKIPESERLEMIEALRHFIDINTRPGRSSLHYPLSLVDGENKWTWQRQSRVPEVKNG